MPSKSTMREGNTRPISSIGEDCGGGVGRDGIVLPRSSWFGKEVILLDDNRNVCGNAYVQFVSPHQCVNGKEKLGKEKVGVVVCKVRRGQTLKLHSLKEWSTHHVLYENATLHEHESEHESLLQKKPQRKGKRAYETKRVAPPRSITKKEKLLSKRDIVETLAQSCCSARCLEQFSVSMTTMLRYEMHEASHEYRMSMKLGVHRNFHYSSQTGHKVSVIEGRVVCMKAWRLLYGVSESSFYEFRKSAKEGLRAQDHGSCGKSRMTNSTEHAVEAMRYLLERKADSMPSRTRTLPSGEKAVEKVLPNGTKWKDLLEDVNKIQVSQGKKMVTQSTVSKIRKRFFSEYIVKHAGDNFARCGTCEKLLSVRNSQVLRSEAWVRYNKKYEDHLREQEAARYQYYASRLVSEHHPESVLSIMHDKMDHGKTASPCFANKTKSKDGLTKLPVSVTGILAHGHGDGKYAHFILDKFTADCNQTIGSICKLLRDLEGEPAYKNPSEMFRNSGHTPLYSHLLVGSDMCENALKRRFEGERIAKKLPPILHVQLDNCWKDNKSRFMMCFWSMLVAKRVFNEVKVSFMVVGHTHDDIDALFGRWSMDLRKNDYPTLPLLMRSAMTLEKTPVIPHLIEEVPDFKKFIKDSICTVYEEELMGHPKGRQFLFTRRADGWPIMQYKICSTDEDFIPEEGIKLWKEDAEGKPILPIGDPKPAKVTSMRGEEDISKGLAGFVEHWKDVSNADRTGRWRLQNTGLIEYWEGVRSSLASLEPEHDSLWSGFWPKTRQSGEVSNPAERLEAGLVEESDEEEIPYIGQRYLQPPRAFRASKETRKGHLVLVHPSVDSAQKVWLGLAESDVNLDVGTPNYRQISLTWYKIVPRAGVDELTCEGWDITRGVKWTPDYDNFENPEWVMVASIISSWKTGARDLANVGIPMRQILAAQHILNVPSNSECA